MVTADWDDDLTLPVRQLVCNTIASAGAKQARVEQLLEALGVAELLHAELSALSDGQRRRVQLFCKLLPERELVLLDEATNSLDVLSRASLLAFLRQESEVRGCTVVFCTHIFDGLDGWATDIAHLDGGRLRRHVSSASLPPNESLYQTVSGWLIEYAHEVRREGAADGSPSLEAIAQALMRAAAASGGNGIIPPLALSTESSPDEPTPKRNKHASMAAPLTSKPMSSSSAALPSGWGTRAAQLQEGAFGAHKWTAPKPDGVTETREALLAKTSPAPVDLTEAPLVSPDEFIASPTFVGSKPGFAFKTGSHGVGYYALSKPGTADAAALTTDPAPAPSPSASQEVVSAPAASSPGAVVEPQPAVPAASGLPAEAMRIAPSLQAALTLLNTRVTACNTAVGKGETPAAVAAAAEISAIWTQAEAALKLFQEAMGGGKGEVRLMPRPAELMRSGSDNRGGDSSLPFGWGASRHAPEAELVSAGRILPQDALGGEK